VSGDTELPLRPDQVFDIAQRGDVVRLLQAIQSELRRRTKDLAELDLDDVLRHTDSLVAS